MVHTLRVLIKIFKPDGFDWMNFALSKKNPYTYHHITESLNGGQKTIDNGAILTKRAHRLLHKLQVYCPDAYNDLQDVFRKINDSKEPVTQEFVDEIDEILKKVLITKEYEFKTKEYSVEKGCTKKIVLDFEDAINHEYTWSSDDPNIATVDDNGVVKGINEGWVYIIATPKDDSPVIYREVRVDDLMQYSYPQYKSNRKVKKL